MTHHYRTEKKERIIERETVGGSGIASKNKGSGVTGSKRGAVMGGSARREQRLQTVKRKGSVTKAIPCYIVYFLSPLPAL